MMPVIGIDSDSTILDIEPVWAAYYASQRENCGHERALSFSDWAEPAVLCRDCFDVCVNSADLLLRSPLMPGCRAALEQLESRFVLALVSHRPLALRPVMEDLYRNLGIFGYFSHFRIGIEDKLHTCRRLGARAMVDDGPHNIARLFGTEVLPIVFDQPYNRSLDYATRAQDWSHVIEILGALWPER